MEPEAPQSTPESRSVPISGSIRVPLKPAEAYALWNRYEVFPQFARSIRGVRRIGWDRWVWDAEIAGVQRVWEARIRAAVPGEMVRWDSVSGPEHSGEIQFYEIASGTLIDVQIRFRPRGAVEQIAARLGSIGRSLRRDLRGFQRFVALPEAARAAAPDASRADPNRQRTRG